MTIRVSTNQMYASSLRQMTQLNADTTRIQNQISTGKRIDGASDDPAGYVQLQSLKRAGTDDTAYAANVKTAQSIVTQGDSTLSSVQTELQRAKELATQAANGTLSDTDRASIAGELDSIRDTLVSLANTKDIRGQSLLGGATTGAAYTKADDGSVSYAGSGTAATIPIGDGDSIQTNVNGQQVFASSDGKDVFALLGELSAALRTGGDDAASAASSAMTGLDTTLDNVTDARASLGAKGARLDLVSRNLTDAKAARENDRSAIEDTDITSATVELQKAMTILQATQASFTKLTSLSLFNYLN